MAIDIGISFNTQTGRAGWPLKAIDITKVERIIAGLDPQTHGADDSRDDEVDAIDITKVERIIADWIKH